MGKEENVIALIAGFMRAKRARMDKLLAGQGIHPAQAPMLFSIFKDNGLTQKQLGEKMHLRPASVTIMLKRLQRAGLIEKTPDTKDLRVFRIYLTEKGKSLKDTVMNAVEAVEQDAVKGLGAEDIAALRRIMATMRGNLEKASED